MFISDMYVEQWHKDKEKVIVMLHGFTGSTKTWQHIAKELPDYHIVAVDLIGHGQSVAPGSSTAYEMKPQLEVLEEIFEKLALSKFTLVGYSMGGRIALSYTVNYPKRVSQLILESASPGLANEADRFARKQADDLLAHKIEANGIASFVEAWENIPLFASQKNLPQHIQQEIRTERLQQSKEGLANSLRGMGTGMMPSMWGHLAEITCPVTLITGDLDKKFVQIAREMKKLIKNAKHYTVEAAGHTIHVENPVKFATIVKETIS